jgi:hypothetical protein
MNRSKVSSVIGGRRKSTVALLVCAVLIMQAVLANTTSAAVDRTALAAEYSQAIREIGTVANMSLNSEQDVRKAIAILQAQKGKLKKGYFSFLVKVAKDNAAFRQGLENRLAAEAAKPQYANRTKPDALKLAGQDFHRSHVRKNPRVLLDIDGGRQAVEAMKSQTRTQAELIKRAANNLQSGVTRLRPRAELETDRPRPTFARVAYYRPAPNDVEMSEPFEPALAQGGALEVVFIAALVVAATIFIAEKAEDVLVEDNPTPTGSQSDFEKCLDAADAKSDSCLAKCPKNAEGKRDPWCEALCWAEHTAAIGACILIPQ